PFRGRKIRLCCFVYHVVSSVKTNLSSRFFCSSFSSPMRIFFFLATKVRAVIVWRNFLSSTTHLCDPNPRRDDDSFFELSSFFGEAGRPLKRSVSNATTK